MDTTWLDISIPFEEEPAVHEGASPKVGMPGSARAQAEWLKRAAWMGTYVTAPPSLELDVEDTERLPLSATVGRARAAPG